MGLVWIAPYITIGIAASRHVSNRRAFETTCKAPVVFAVQLGFNLERIDLALIEIAVLLCATITNMIKFWRVDRLPGLLFARGDAETGIDGLVKRSVEGTEPVVVSSLDDVDAAVEILSAA